MVNLELYKIFVIVAKEKNLTKASQILNVSQPALTKHIKNLENELNVILFTRSKGMQLTKSGQQLYDIVSPAINKLINADNIFKSSKNINFGTYPTMLSKVLGNCIAKFYQENQYSKITAITEPFDSLFDKFQNYELDILVSNKINENLYDVSKTKYIKLGYSEFVLISNTKNNLQKKVIDIEDLKDKIIYIPRGKSTSSLSFLKLINEKGLNNNIKQIDSITMSNIIQKYDNCIGLVNKNYIKEEINYNKVSILNINFEIPSTEFGIYVHKNNIFPDLKHFIKILKYNL